MVGWNYSYFCLGNFMKAILLLVLCAPLLSMGQRAGALIFQEPNWDFGNIAEKDGPVEHEFVFINNSGSTLRIADVTATCGCTTPSWSREPIPAGGSGTIRARFDPKGRPGFFSKMITLTTDPPTGNTMVQIRGNVSSDTGGEALRLDHVQGHLSARSATLQMGKVFNNQPAVSRAFKIRNQGTEPLRISKAVLPPYIQTTYPPVLKPGETADLVVRYDARSRKSYGYAADQITLVTSDSEQPEKHFIVAATLEEYFEPLKPGQAGIIPVLALAPSDLKLGSIGAQSAPERTVTLTNNGRSDLLIRAAVPNCTCLAVENLPTRIPAGRSATVILRFTPNGRTGRQNKAVLIYSNDPISPVQRVTLSAQVSDQ